MGCIPKTAVYVPGRYCASSQNNTCGKLLIATTNPGKIVEIRDLLRGQPWTVVDPVEINISPEIEETGQDYAENAALKARGMGGGLRLLGSGG